MSSNNDAPAHHADEKVSSMVPGQGSASEADIPQASTQTSQQNENGASIHFVTWMNGFLRDDPWSVFQMALKDGQAN
ncbi:unnamed protein product [Clonostachys rosea]|uniref:Uncharacterized protein n=1 Tax=Bionectria ochroleuca TaxID=29856 RepID=A0ABY6UZY5_BIOOC|nr:unnamed protein product [Clonostachys rosea]